MSMDSTKSALVTGVTGQDGAYLAELLLGKGYKVHGLARWSSLPHTDRIRALCREYQKRLCLHYGDMTDGTGLLRIVAETKPDEIYNLAAQSHVHVSFALPEFTALCDALGPLRLLEAVRTLGLAGRTRFYQASTSELYGNASLGPQNETTLFAPRSPYAIAKLYAYWTTVNYRQSYGIHASNGILFNHESPMRGEDFVTRKITRGVARLVRSRSVGPIVLGNLDARRDWGHARDYVDAMWRMLQQEAPDDYVIASGETRSVREFVEHAFRHAHIDIKWVGEGLNERGICPRTGQTLVAVDARFFRPAEVNILQGDPAKSYRVLGWRATTSFSDLVKEMVEADMALAGVAE